MCFELPNDVSGCINLTALTPWVLIIDMYHDILVDSHTFSNEKKSSKNNLGQRQEDDPSWQGKGRDSWEKKGRRGGTSAQRPSDPTVAVTLFGWMKDEGTILFTNIVY